MDVTRISAYSSLAKDLKALWDGLSGEDRDKVDAICKRLVQAFVPEGTLDRQRHFFLTSNDVLPMKLVGLFLDKEVRETVKSKIKGMSHSGEVQFEGDVLQGVIVKCRQCGSLQQLDDPYMKRLTSPEQA